LIFASADSTIFRFGSPELKFKLQLSKCLSWMCKFVHFSLNHLTFWLLLEQAYL